jgi:hypothetical protein
MMLAVPKVDSTNNSGINYQDYNPAFGNVDHIRPPKHLHFYEPNYVALYITKCTHYLQSSVKKNKVSVSYFLFNHAV